MLDLTQLRCFVAVADDLSFTQAAARLGYSPSNVSQHVRRLERALRLHLFARTSRRVELTPEGLELLDRARLVLDAEMGLQRRAEELTSEHGRRLVLTYGPYTGDLAAELVRELQAAHPDAELDVQGSVVTVEALEALAAGRADVALTKWVKGPFEKLVLRSPHEVVLLVPEGHRFEGRASVTIEDLDGEPMLWPLREQNEELHDSIAAFFAERGVHPIKRSRRIVSPDQSYEFVAARQGVARVIKTRTPPPGTSFVPVSGPFPDINDLYLVWHRRCRAELLEPALEVASKLWGDDAARPCAEG